MAWNAWLSHSRWRARHEVALGVHTSLHGASTGWCWCWGRAVTGTGRQATTRPLTPRPLLRPLQLDTHGTRPACNVWHLTWVQNDIPVGRFTKSFHCIVWAKHMIIPGIFCMCAQSHHACWSSSEFSWSQSLGCNKRKAVSWHQCCSTIWHDRHVICLKFYTAGFSG